MVAGVARPGWAVVLRLSRYQRLGWVLSAVPVACATPCPKRVKGAVMSMVSSVIGGVDTRADVHVAAAIDGNGGVLGIESFPADAGGYEALVGWLVGFGPVSRVGVEGTGSYGSACPGSSTTWMSTWWRWIDRTGRPVAGWARSFVLLPLRRRGLLCLGWRQ